MFYIIAILITFYKTGEELSYDYKNGQTYIPRSQITLSTQHDEFANVSVPGNEYHRALTFAEGDFQLFCRVAEARDRAKDTVAEVDMK